MPKKTKAVPDDRAEWTFGDALYSHFFIRGTRPDGSPNDKSGTIWVPKSAAGEINVTIRAFWNWIDDRHYPYDTAAIERTLFGTSKLYDDDRNELRRLLREARQGRRVTVPEHTTGTLPAVIVGQLVTVHTTPFEDSEVDGPLDAADLRAIAPWSLENFGKSGANSFRDSALSRVLPIGGRTAEGPNSPTGPSPRSRKTVVAMFAGLVLLLGGYGVKRYLDYSKETPGPVTANQDQPKPPSPGLEQKPTTIDVVKPPTIDPEAERRAAEAKRQEEKRLAAEKAALDAIARERAAKEAAARDLNAKLKAMAQAEVEGCQKVLEGVSVPGFTLKCDTLIPFGKLLGSVPVSQTASSLGDCAARCRKVAQCVAFSFDAGAHTGSASCYLSGSITSYNKAKNWIAGTR